MTTFKPARIKGRGKDDQEGGSARKTTPDSAIKNPLFLDGHKLSAGEVAARAGISRGLLQRTEKGKLTCAIGVVFEVAAIVGVRLFDADETTLSRHLNQTRDKLALLPQSVRKPRKTVRDDF